MSGLWAFVMLVTAVVALPNIYKFERHDTQQKVLNLLKSKNDVLNFISKQHKPPRQRVDVTSFSYKDCGSPSALLNIKSLSVVPDPLAFPGPLYVAASIVIHSDLGDPLPADLYIAKKIEGTYVKIPCIDNFGSCSYPDVCVLLEQVQCPDPLVKIGLDCQCPLKTNSYTLPLTEFDVDASIIPAGDYHIIGNITYNGQEGACLDMYLTFQ